MSSRFYNAFPSLRPYRVALTTSFLCGIGYVANSATNSYFDRTNPKVMSDEAYIKAHEQWMEDMNLDPISKFPLPEEGDQPWHRKYKKASDDGSSDNDQPRSPRDNDRPRDNES